MNKVAIAFSTKDRVELSKQSFARIKPADVDIFLVDGSSTKEGQEFAEKAWAFALHGNVRGGADAAIVFSLTTMLQHPDQYTHVGLVENDVLLHPDWFGPTFALFERGKADGLEVGAVSARCYEDRVLFQRDGYAVVHNIGAGMIILTRKAAALALQNFRTGYWSENRRIFAQLCGLDIGRWGAFRANEQWVVADWRIDAILAAHGLCSLALTPSPVEMIGQVPPLHEQGLTIVTEPVELLRNDKAFEDFRHQQALVRSGAVKIPSSIIHQMDDGSHMIFPHQIPMVGGKYDGDWLLKWSQGFGPFAWKAGQELHGDTLGNVGYKHLPMLTVPVSGPCSLLVSGGEKGGKVCVEDLASGYKLEPELPAEGEQTSVLNLPIPANVSYRDIRLTMLTPGTLFYGLQTREAQPTLPNVKFTHATLPPV